MHTGTKQTERGKKRPHKRFKGVYFNQQTQKWWAQLYVNHKSFYGSYDTEEQAARAYDTLALKLHGAFAHLNFPEIAEAARVAEVDTVDISEPLTREP